MKQINQSIIENAMTYGAYRALIDEKFAKDQTTGADHSPAMLNYTKMNLARMNRLDKRAKLTPETLARLASINRKMIWLVITEGWCGDAAQIVPVLYKMAQEQPNIQLRFILRDEHLELMDQFLTNGGRSIPKILMIDPEAYSVEQTWGPRPAEMQEMILSNKAETLATADPEEKQRLKEESAKNLHLWYAKDKTKTTQKEFLLSLASII